MPLLMFHKNKNKNIVITFTFLTWFAAQYKFLHYCKCRAIIVMEIDTNSNIMMNADCPMANCIMLTDWLGWPVAAIVSTSLLLLLVSVTLTHWNNVYFLIDFETLCKSYIILLFSSVYDNCIILKVCVISMNSTVFS